MQLLNWQQDFISSKKNCLWCSTGMGKSRVGGFLLSIKQNGVVICPPHLIKEWIEIGKENGITIVELNAVDKVLNLTDNNIFYVVSINKVALYDILLTKHFDILILDEAHRFKNYKSQSWKTVIKIADRFDCKYAMTATFITQNDCDLIAPALIVVDELRKKYSGSYYKFIQTKGNCTFKDQFIKATMIAGIMRNTVKVETGLTPKGKEEILKYFYITDYEKAGMKKPECIIKKVHFDLTKEHIKTLDKEEFPVIEEISDLDFKFSDLHQVINCFSYKTDKTFSLDEKLAVLKSIIDNENGKGLVFYYFKKNQSVLGQIKGLIEYDGYESIKTFEESNNKVMFANYKSIGEGIRFKKCDFIIEFDMIFDYGAIIQSRGRLQYAGRQDIFKIYRVIPNHEQIKRIEDNLETKQTFIDKYTMSKNLPGIENKIEKIEKIQNNNNINFWDMI